MGRKYVSRVFVLAAFLLLPLVVYASPVTFLGGVNLATGSGAATLTVFAPSFNVPSDTAAVTTINLASVGINGVGPWNIPEQVGANFSQPSVLNLGTPFQFTIIGAGPGAMLSVTQSGAQDITLGGVNYHLTFALSQLSLLPGQTATVRATLTPSSAVPEPATMLLLGTGLVGIAAKVRKRNKIV